MASQGFSHPSSLSSSDNPYPEKPAAGVAAASSGGVLSRIKAWSLRKKLVVFGLLGLALLALILGLAIGLTVGNDSASSPTLNNKDDGSFIPNSNGPSGVDGTRASLLQAGSFYTSNDNTSDFLWTSSDTSLQDYRSDFQGVDVTLDSSNTHQTIDGFGSALTDSSAYLLSKLKSDQGGLYNRLMDYLFHNATGSQAVRITMGSSDFSVGQQYSYIASSKAPSFGSAPNMLNDLNSLLSGFSIENTQTSRYVIPVLVDALKRNPDLKVIVSPWSPPAFMKTNNSLDKGSLRAGFVPVAAEYYVRTVKAYIDAGVTPHSMTLQNEPSFESNYPSMGANSTVQSSLAAELKTRLAANGLDSIKVMAHDDNYDGWESAAAIVNQNASSVDGIAFHCYEGQPEEVSNFTSALDRGVAVPEIHMTECTGTDFPTSRFGAIQSWLTRVHVPVLSQNSRSVLMWNLALDADNGPHLKSSNCDNCVGAVTVDTSNKTSAVGINAQSYLINQFATVTTNLTNVGGGPAVRIGSTFPGNQPTLSNADQQCLMMVAFAAPLNGATLPSPNNANDAAPQRRIGLVIQNACNSQKEVVVSSDGRRRTVVARPGLESFVWIAP